MRNRIGCAAQIGIGRSIGTDYGLTNDFDNLTQEQIDLVKEMCIEYFKSFASWYKEGDEKYASADFGYDPRGYFIIGWEPSYQYEPLNLINIDLLNKNNTFRISGTSFGPYGTKVASKMKYFRDYKIQNKYTRFIDKYFDRLKELFPVTVDERIKTEVMIYGDKNR